MTTTETHNNTTAEVPTSAVDEEEVVIPRPHPEANPHSKIEEIFPDIYFVRGSATIFPGVVVGSSSYMKFAISRNMIILRDKGTSELTLVNSLRLSEEGLKELDQLGKVTTTVRLAAFHGMDDPFYKERYNATSYAIGKYFPGTNPEAPPYFRADKELSSSDKNVLPIKNCQVILLDNAKLPEALLVLELPNTNNDMTFTNGGQNNNNNNTSKILFSGDTLTNWDGADDYFSRLGAFAFWCLGETKPLQVSPAWYSNSKPSKGLKEEILKLLDLQFDHMLPSHGNVVVGNAYEKFEASIRGLKET